MDHGGKRRFEGLKVPEVSVETAVSVLGSLPQALREREKEASFLFRPLLFSVSVTYTESNYLHGKIGNVVKLSYKIPI